MCIRDSSLSSIVSRDGLGHCVERFEGIECVARAGGRAPGWRGSLCPWKKATNERKRSAVPLPSASARGTISRRYLRISFPGRCMPFWSWVSSKISASCLGAESVKRGSKSPKLPPRPMGIPSEKIFFCSVQPNNREKLPVPGACGAGRRRARANPRSRLRGEVTKAPDLGAAR